VIWESSIVARCQRNSIEKLRRALRTRMALTQKLSFRNAQSRTENYLTHGRGKKQQNDSVSN
jgi:hypothetical protein